MAEFSFPSLIEKKKRRLTLDEAEIRYWVGGLTGGDIPDYQTAAMLMAIWFNGMSFEETLALTNAMTDSGDRLRFEGYAALADKHSTGGVGDKVTLILGPLMAACGLPTTMLSGRGLGFTGGTIDKFESLPGVSCDLDNAAMQRMLDRIGWANAQASERIAPADRRLYSLRDVTATIDSIPLITASILSKKIAGGATHLCLDVKCGRSAFMQDLDSARSLARHLKTIGEMGGLSITGVVSRMDEPLGHAVGNYLELLEAVRYLKEERPTPLMALVLALGEKMLIKGGRVADAETARAAMRQALTGGVALEKLTAYLAAAGGESAAIERLVSADFDDFERTAILAGAGGAVAAIDGRGLGEFLIEIGAGRIRRKDRLDPMAGLVLNKQVGDCVEKGEPLGWLYGAKAAAAAEKAQRAVGEFFRVQAEPEPLRPLVIETF